MCIDTVSLEKYYLSELIWLYGKNFMSKNVTKTDTLSSQSLKKDSFCCRILSFSLTQLNIKSHPLGPWIMASEKPSVFLHTE